MIFHPAGSEKSTLAKHLVDRDLTLPSTPTSTASPHSHPRRYAFSRLSIDELIYTNHGMYGIDYLASSYGAVSASVEPLFTSRVRTLLSSPMPSSREGQLTENVILDRAFYSQKDRKEWREWLEGAMAARVKLIWLDVKEEELWRRIVERRDPEKLDADCARDISRDILGDWVKGFEKPDEGEGAIVVRWHSDERYR